MPEKFLRAESDTLQQAYDRLAANFRAIQAWAHQLLENPHTHQRDTELTGVGPEDAAQASVATSQATTSTTYTDLTTPGPAVTLVPGPSGIVLVFLAARIIGSGSMEAKMGCALSSGNTVAASESEALGSETTTGQRRTRAILYQGLVASSTVFTAKYKASAGTGTFNDRSIIVIPL